MKKAWKKAEISEIDICETAANASDWMVMGLGAGMMSGNMTKPIKVDNPNKGPGNNSGRGNGNKK